VGVETLERRILLSGPIIFNATAADDTISVNMTLSTITVTLNSVNFNYSTSGVTRLELNAGNGNDQVDIENTSLPVWLNTGSGNNVILVQLGGQNLNFVSGAIVVQDSPGNNQAFIYDGNTQTAQTFTDSGEEIQRPIPILGAFSLTHDSTLQQITLITGKGNDTVNVTNADPVNLVTYNNLGGNDLVHFMAPFAFKGRFMVESAVGHSAIQLDDASAAVGTTPSWAFTDSAGVGNLQTSQSGVPTVNWNDGEVNSVLVNLAHVENTVVVKSIGTPVSIVGSTYPEHYYVSSDGTAQNGDLSGIKARLSINGGSGVDEIHISEAGLLTADTVAIDEAIGRIYSTLPGGWDIRIPGPANNGGITFSAGMGNDTLNVLSTFLNEPYTVRGGGGDDTFNVANNTFNYLTIDGQAGYNTANFSFAAGMPSDSGWNVTDQYVQAVRRTGNGGLVTQTISIQSFSLTAGDGDTIVNVISTAANAFYQIQAGAGNNQFSLGLNSTKSIRAYLQLFGTAGVNTLALNDAADSLDTTVHLADAFINAGATDNLLGVGGLLYTPDMNAVTVNLGSGSDSIFVSPSAVSTFNVNAHNPTVAPGDTLTVAMANVTNPVLTPGGVGAGSFAFDNAQPLNYTGIETLIIDNTPTALGNDTISSVAAHLNWSPVGGVDEYHVERADAGGPFIDIATVGAAASSFADAGLTPGTPYVYRVRASAGGVFSDYSPVVGVQTLLAGGNDVFISPDADGLHADAWMNSLTPGQGAADEQLLIPLATNFTVNGGAGNDRLTVDFSGASPLPAGGLNFDGADGTGDTISFVGSTLDDVISTIAAGSFTFANDALGVIPLSLAHVEAIQLIGGSGGADMIEIAAGSYIVDADTALPAVANVTVVVSAAGAATFTSDQHLAGLVLSGNGVASVAGAVRRTIEAPIVSIADSGKLDLGISDLLTDTAAATIRGYLKTGYSVSEDWSGAGGITSTLAAGNPTTYTIGYASGDDISAQDAGIPAVAGQVLVRPSLVGDANLDGKVDFFDITQLLGYKYNTGQPAAYTDGDLDYSDNVDFFDIVQVLSANYNTGVMFAPASAVEPSASPWVPIAPKTSGAAATQKRVVDELRGSRPVYAN
jgi:hypothetical protein